ncbi:MAG: class I SAM-dependent rRNA methyltransferase [Chlamydiales bacterium]
MKTEMQSQGKVVLKPGKEKALLQRHPWIFSGAVQSLPDMQAGEVFSVHSSAGEFLAKAYFNPDNSLVGRVLTFFDEPPAEAVKREMRRAYALRQILPLETNAYRLINAEGDGLPGLIVDRYDDVLVMQIHTQGMEKFRSLIIEELVALIQPRTIYEKSHSSAREQEGLVETQGVVWGEECDLVEMRERELLFQISLKEGQKTGFFLDQREMRAHVMRHAKGRRVLNCFSYTGAFALFALAGGAESATSVDSSKKAVEQAEKNTRLNGFSPEQHKLICEDAFLFLRKNPLDFNLVVLDPPAFIKKRSDVVQGCKGYQEINRLVLEKIPSNSFLLTSSCSYYLDESLFQKVLFQAAFLARRKVRILAKHVHAEDHPTSLYHPEGAYLKSFFLHVE